MREEKGLDYQVRQESASIRIIPEDLFRGRDVIPAYGFFQVAGERQKK